ncbi:hypothetical protein [Paenibacillus massiliensis]|uniref:hypothetical protein n=1 Tax=Paenibacillus massiliensis TaxID=225917 RepID=UPI00041EDBD6|nr:hypothetical protein [Paenibacillus massiliensis]
MANIEGMAYKFQVIKGTDIDNLPHESKVALGHIVEEVVDNRRAEGKPINSYLVINTDEPYADEVIEIMKRHGHWG